MLEIRYAIVRHLGPNLSTGQKRYGKPGKAIFHSGKSRMEELLPEQPVS